MPEKRDKTTGLPLPNPVVPADTICVQLTIPNAPEYRQALRGVLSELGKHWTWQQTVGESAGPANEAAELWRRALMTMVYSDDCGAIPMSCADVANCIETSEAVQSAITAQILGSDVIRTEIENTASRGAPLSGAGLIAPLYEECEDFAALYGAVKFIIQTMNRVNEDLLEIIETATNEEEQLALFMNAVPIIETLPVGEIISFAQGTLEQITENYLSVYTETYEEELICDLFCIVKNNPGCEITYEIIFDYFAGKVGGGLSTETIFYDLVGFLTFGTWPGTQIVDAMMMFQMGAWRWAGRFMDLSLKRLSVVAQLGANSPVEDWPLLCEDCYDPQTCFDFTTGWQGWAPVISGYARLDVSPTTPGIYRGGTNARMYIKAPTQFENVVGISIRWNKAYSGVFTMGPQGSPTLYSGNTGIIWNQTFSPSKPPGWVLNFYTSAAVQSVPADMRIVEICLTYE